MNKNRIWNEWFEEIRGESGLELLLLAAAKRRRKRKIRYGAMVASALAFMGLICWQMWQGEPNAEGRSIANGPSAPLPKRNHELLPKFPEAGGYIQAPQGAIPANPITVPDGLAAKPAQPEPDGKFHVSLTILSDEELFDLLKGQSVALVGEKGNRRVVFLEPVSAGKNPEPKHKNK